MAKTSPGLPLRVKQITEQSADETIGLPVNCAGYPHVTIYIKGHGTTSSGVITIETADYDEGGDYSGTWSSIATVNASDVTGDVQKHTLLTVGAWAYVRTRISTVIGGGGTISTVLVAS